MKWVVNGCDKNTGIEQSIEVEADDAQSAERRAGRGGMLVAAVALAPAKPPPAPLDYAAIQKARKTRQENDSLNVHVSPTRKTSIENAVLCLAAVIFILLGLVGGFLMVVGYPDLGRAENIMQQTYLQITDAEFRLMGLGIIMLSIVILLAAGIWSHNRICRRQNAAMIELAQRIANSVDKPQSAID